MLSLREAGTTIRLTTTIMNPTRHAWSQWEFIMPTVQEKEHSGNASGQYQCGSD